MTEQISDKALARKKAFSKNKEEAGDAHKLMNQKRDWIIFFDETGHITCVTQNPNITPKKTWQTYPFTQEELKILELDGDAPRIKQFRVEKDDMKIGVYVLKHTEPESRRESASSFMSEIDIATKEADFCCEVDGRTITFSVSDSLREEITTGIAPGGYRTARIFVTARHNPHLLYSLVSVNLGKLLDGPVIETLPNNIPEDFSLYTMKIFKSYGRYNA